MPTYFSLFGFANLQKRGQPLVLKERSILFNQLYDFTNSEVFVSSHTFENPKNFSVEDGKLMIIDYGDKRIHCVLIKYGDKIHNEFDLNYVRLKKNKDLP
ncbi:MAG: hypothetical protein V1928_01760 [Parcubacteria group bacterium]